MIIRIVSIFLCLVLSGCGYTTYETSDKYEKTGEVVALIHIERKYLNPVNDLNPMKNLDPSFSLRNASTPEKFLLTIKIDGKDVVFDNRGLFSSVKVGSKVKIFFGKTYRVQINGEGKVDQKVYVGDTILSASVVD